jgi:hypothetical protein
VDANNGHWLDDDRAIPVPAGRSFLLDTNVLLHDADSLHAFEEHNLILTIDVLEELDRFKRGNDEKGRNARRVIRDIDALRDGRSLSQGVDLPGGGKIYILVRSFTEFLTSRTTASWRRPAPCTRRAPMSRSSRRTSTRA